MCSSSRDDRKLENTVKKSRFKHLGELHKEWTEAGVSASRVTTLRHLQEKGYQATSETETMSEASYLAKRKRPVFIKPLRITLNKSVTILDFSYHGYCGHKNSRYWYIAVCIEILGGSGVYQSNYFLLCLLSFYFSPNKHKDTDKRRARDSGFLCLLWSFYEITREKILSSSAVWWLNINGNTLQ